MVQILDFNKKKKVMITIEEDKSPDGKEIFKIYLDGDADRIGKIPNDQLKPFEYFGGALYNICIGSLQQSGYIPSPER